MTAEQQDTEADKTLPPQAGPAPEDERTLPPGHLANDSADGERTQPPEDLLRYQTPSELYEAMPQVGRLTQNRPRDGETNVQFLSRLAGSTTPEECVTFTAFALQAKMAIWWGYECVRVTGRDLPEDARYFMDLVARWIGYPCERNRFDAARTALWADKKSPAQYLALAVAWSGGPLAPNDPSAVPPHKAPRAVNSAVLSSLAQASFEERPKWLARHIDQAKLLMRDTAQTR